ncbi:hypothetical protein [Aeromicrobium sp. 179-A 4D2 NHS]|uniref:hypothetical protein n=1 Tax=Aeromicrobium sp. 179-A 4D2 NHS TaxID=3142375 RepID=UPI00399F9563
MTVYMIKADRHYYDGEGFRANDVTDHEVGYFTDEDEADQYARGLNVVNDDQYAAYIDRIDERNEKACADYATASKAHNVLVAAGLPSDEPRRPDQSSPMSYNQWLYAHDIITYRVVTVGRANAVVE